MNRMKFATAALAALATSVATAGPIGTLDVDAAYDLRAADASQFVRFTDVSATWFSGDTLRTRNGVAVINFTDGGAIGVRENSQVRIEEGADSALAVDLIAGEVMVALNPRQTDFTLVSGNFSVTPAVQAGRMQVALGENLVATVRRLDDGNLKVDVQSGEFQVRNGDVTQVSVGAGESIGLLDVPAFTATQVQNQRSAAQAASQGRGTAPNEEEVPFEAPEDAAPQEEFEVDWGENEIPVGDFLAVAPVDSDASMFDSVVRIGPEKIIEVTAPAAEGEYEIRIIDEETGGIRIWAPLTVSQDAGLFIPLQETERLVGGGIIRGGSLLGYAIAGAAGAASMYIIREREDCNCNPGSISP